MLEAGFEVNFKKCPSKDPLHKHPKLDLAPIEPPRNENSITRNAASERELALDKAVTNHITPIQKTISAICEGGKVPNNLKVKVHFKDAESSMLHFENLREAGLIWSQRLNKQEPRHVSGNLEYNAFTNVSNEALVEGKKSRTYLESAYNNKAKLCELCDGALNCFCEIVLSAIDNERNHYTCNTMIIAVS